MIRDRPQDFLRSHLLELVAVAVVAVEDGDAKEEIEGEEGLSSGLVTLLEAE